MHDFDYLMQGLYGMDDAFLMAMDDPESVVAEQVGLVLGNVLTCLLEGVSRTEALAAVGDEFYHGYTAGLDGLWYFRKETHGLLKQQHNQTARELLGLRGA